MAVNLNILKEKLESSFNNAKVEIYDEVGDGNHLSLSIVSDDFSNLSLLERHKLIYDSLKEYMTYIHALSISAKTNNGD